nr:hypothetical protein [Tanacetum cinerariifolium]
MLLEQRIEPQTNRGWRLKMKMKMNMKMKMKMRYDARRGRQQTDATFDLSEPYFSSKTLDDACKGIQNEIADTSEACAAINGSAHITNQGAIWNYKRFAGRIKIHSLIHIEEELLLAFKHECCLSETRKESRMNGFSVLFGRFIPRISISFTSGSKSASDVWGVLQAMCYGLTPK